MNRIDEFHGQPAVELIASNGDCATVLLYGAHVVSWIPAGGTERLYLSERSAYGGGCAVRGGVPVIFPQFNQRGPDFNVPRHGFARTRSWVVDESGAAPPMQALPKDTLRPATASITLRLTDDVDTRSLWPHQFSLTMTVTLSPQCLDMTLRAVNTGLQPLSFTAALHTYLQVADVGQASVGGLQDVRFLDTVTNVGGTGAVSPLRFARETDRIYFDVPGPLSVLAPNGTLNVAMQGFQDAVIWNPWTERCAALPDMPDDGYRQMLCIEAAVIGKPVRLERSGEWEGRQIFTALS